VVDRVDVLYSPQGWVRLGTTLTTAIEVIDADESARFQLVHEVAKLRALGGLVPVHRVVEIATDQNQVCLACEPSFLDISDDASAPPYQSVGQCSRWGLGRGDEIDAGHRFGLEHDFRFACGLVDFDALA
jgi:hypothetical protein